MQKSIKVIAGIKCRTFLKAIKTQERGFLFVISLFSIHDFPHIVYIIKFSVLFQGNLDSLIGFSSDFYAAVSTDITNFDVITVFQVYF